MWWQRRGLCSLLLSLLGCFLPWFLSRVWALGMNSRSEGQNVLESLGAAQSHGSVWVGWGRARSGAVIPKGLGEDAESGQEPSYTSVLGWNLSVGHRDGAGSLFPEG